MQAYPLAKVICVPSSPILLAAVAVVVDESKLLVWETPEGFLELPGFIVAQIEKALLNIEELIGKLNLGTEPQQTLYLRQIPLVGSSRKPIPAVVRVIRVKPEMRPSFGEGGYKNLSSLIANKRVSPLTRLVAQWMTRSPSV